MTLVRLLVDTTPDRCHLFPDMFSLFFFKDALLLHPLILLLYLAQSGFGHLSLFVFVFFAQFGSFPLFLLFELLQYFLLSLLLFEFGLEGVAAAAGEGGGLIRLVNHFIKCRIRIGSRRRERGLHLSCWGILIGPRGWSTMHLLRVSISTMLL